MRVATIVVAKYIKIYTKQMISAETLLSRRMIYELLHDTQKGKTAIG